MASIKKYPLSILDEPATYTDFMGGINSDPSNENLNINELRDAVNMHYSNTTLKNRFGASKHLEIYSTDPITNVQGIFLYTGTDSYIIVASDGRLYYSLYYPEATIELKRLPIRQDSLKESLENNPQDQFTDLPIKNVLTENITHDGYVLNKDGVKELIFQNKRKIEAASYQNKLYIATGTRLVYIISRGNRLEAKVLQPYEPNGLEYQQIGPNLLSPFPSFCIKKVTDSVRTAIHGIVPVKDKNGNYVLNAIMSYGPGEDVNDYFFKWEKIKDDSIEPVGLHGYDSLKLIYNSVIGLNNQPISKGRSSITVNELEFKDHKYRCSFAKSFKRDGLKENSPYITEKISLTDETSYEDYVVDKLDGAWFGSAMSIPAGDGKASDFWKEIQSCTKIISDGNKFILYDDMYNSGNWWKTVIDNPNYITYRGSLNFKTDKNENIVKVIQFKGIIVVFCNNDLAGGNISVVTGNGDDFPDENYSPYIRKVVNTNFGCDNPYTVQVADNMIIFKYKDTVYIIEGSEFNSEIIEVQSVNDKLKLKSKDVNIPWDDNNCISEITSDYYALIWKEELSVYNDEVYVSRPAMRVKMYYKLGAMELNRVVFPWLRDESFTFNVDHIFYIKGIPTHLYNNLLLQYNKSVFKDIDTPFTSVLHLRAVDLNYPKFIKFINSVMVYYHRGPGSVINFNMKIYNESGHMILDTGEEITAQDYKVFQPGDVIDSETRFDATILDSKVFNVPYRFPCLLADTIITINNQDDFSLSSITYNYTTADMPDTTQFDEYRKFIRRENVGVTLKDKIRTSKHNELKNSKELKSGDSKTKSNTVVRIQQEKTN